jgi:hypothetical protein
MSKNEKQFGERFQTWYHENHDNKIEDELPIFQGRTPESEIKYKLLWTFIILLAFFGVLVYVISQI